MEVEVTVRRVLEISRAVDMVGDNTLLDAKVAYRLGRLGDNCKSPLKTYQKKLTSTQTEIADKQRDLQKDLSAKSEDERKKNMIEVEKLNEEYNKVATSLLEETEKLDIPKFQLSNFMAAADKKIVRAVGKGEDSRNTEIVYKPGDLLVPVQFFSLMGDLIEDDKEAMK